MRHPIKTGLTFNGLKGIDRPVRIDPARGKENNICFMPAGKLETIDGAGQVRINDVRGIIAESGHDRRFGGTLYQKVYRNPQYQIFGAAYITMDKLYIIFLEAADIHLAPPPL
jgi:hypothetical protein